MEVQNRWCTSLSVSLHLKLPDWNSPTLLCQSPFLCVCMCAITHLANSLWVGPHTHTHRNKHHKHAETNYLWNLWNNCGSSPQLWELCIICLTFPAFGFLLFYLSNGRKISASLIASGQMMEPLTSLWKDFERTLKKHHNQRRERLPQSSQSVLTDVQNHQLYLGFNSYCCDWTEPWTATGH